MAQGVAAMSDEWMPTIRLPITKDAFVQLPRNSAYRYEYVGGEALLSPRPKHYHVSRRLKLSPVPGMVDCRPALTGDLESLVPLFASCFQHIQPFGSLDEAMRERASRTALERTYGGGDGPLIAQASFVAWQGQDAVGCVLITLLPGGDPSEVSSYQWQEAPPADCIQRRAGRPHLTWIFVEPRQAGHGIGSALLGASANSLLHLGYTELLSTFMIGNDSSMLWHWRNGFRLLAHPQSPRRSETHDVST
jgi:GNAT superfamily N-acetyltransferase